MKHKNQIFISSIPSNCTKEDLKKFLIPYGKFKDFEYNPKEGSLNYNMAKITFYDSASFASILSNQPHYIKGCKIKVRKYAEGKKLVDVEESIQNRRLYVKSLPPEASDEEIWDLFSNFGEVELFYSCRLKRIGNTPTDYGFITFKNKRVAEIVLKKHVMFFPKYNSAVYIFPFKAKGKKINIGKSKEEQKILKKKKKNEVNNGSEFGNNNEVFSQNKRNLKYKNKRVKNFGKDKEKKLDKEAWERRQTAIKNFSRIFGVKEKKKSAIKLLENDGGCLWKV